MRDRQVQEYTFIDLIGLNYNLSKRNGQIMMKKINQVSESMNWRINLKRYNLEKNKIKLFIFLIEIKFSNYHIF